MAPQPELGVITLFSLLHTQPSITCSKSTIEILEEGMKHVQS